MRDWNRLPLRLPPPTTPPNYARTSTYLSSNVCGSRIMISLILSMMCYMKPTSVHLTEWCAWRVRFQFNLIIAPRCVWSFYFRADHLRPSPGPRLPSTNDEQLTSQSCKNPAPAIQIKYIHTHQRQAQPSTWKTQNTHVNRTYAIMANKPPKFLKT